MKSSWFTAVVVGVAICLFQASTAHASLSVRADVDKAAVWSGKVLVEQQVRVLGGAVLTIKPGTAVRFRKGAGLVVVGTLKAEGTKNSPIIFTSDLGQPAADDWTGISFEEAGKDTSLRYCSISYASAISIASCDIRIRDCELKNGVQGIAFARKARSRVENCTIKNMQNGGITCQLGAFPELVGNTIDSTGTGISCTQDSKPAIKNNTVSGCATGLGLAGTLPAIEGNTLKNNKTGLVLSTGNGLVRGNRISGSQTGLLCQQFSNPAVEKNEIFGNSEGLVCFRASSPEIKNNEIYKNGNGISCVQLCSPKISSNNIHDNKKGLYLDMSSYAVVHGNNIFANEVQLELGNMSSDWEKKSKSKPERGGQAQNLTMASRGRAVQQQVEDGAQIMGFVDAAGNWWGDATTAEMDAKGPNANIKSFIDYYDVPTRTYEGYSGIFVQDKIKYTGWKKSKIKINTQ